MRFRTWAPTADSVHLVLDARTIPLTREPDEEMTPGWWSVEVPEATAGVAYRYRINGEGPFPDPRSAWQPQGPHEPSVVVDHSAFDWGDDHFRAVGLDEAIIYELHVGTFSPEGTYTGVRSRLDHLRQLGVTHIELMPLATFPGERGWGYDGVSLFAPHPAYGRPDDLKALIKEAHSMGMAVILDVVYNHLGPDGNYLAAFGPYFTDRHHTPWGTAINLDEAWSTGAREYFIDNALMWLRDYRFDGLRLDAVHALTDRSAIHFLEELSQRVDALERETDRPLILIAESDLNDPRFVHDIDRGGFGLDAHWIDDFHHALHAALTGEHDGYYVDYGSIGDLAKALRQGYVFDGQHSPHRMRRHGRPPSHVRPDQLVVCSQNHDQVGNRALGDRLCHLVDPARTRAAATLTILSPFVPMLFQGEEWAASSPFLYFTDHTDPELGAAITKGRRREFAAFKSHSEDIPDPQARETFLQSKLRWDELSESQHAEVLHWYQELIRIRSEYRNDILDGPQDVSFDEEQRWICLSYATLRIIVNLGDREVAPDTCGLPDREILLSFPADLSTESPLPAGAVAVVKT